VKKGKEAYEAAVNELTKHVKILKRLRAKDLLSKPPV